MRRFSRLICGLVLCAALLATATAAAAIDQRIALVIGNSAYSEAPLKNPANDARAIAASLRARGFEVMVRENANKQQMETTIADFGEKLSEGATALFFYAGHGMQVNGRNYLIPTNARITSEQRVRAEAVDVDMVLEQMQAARVKVSMVILDACRNNPFERRFRSLSGGLAQINAPEGTLIAYATAPGKVAADGDGANGLYTQELLKALSQPGLKVEDVFKQVRVNVSRLSNGAQTPWEASSLTGDFYFSTPQAAAAPAAAPAQVAALPAPAAPPSQQTLELAFWDAVKNSNNAVELQAYLDTFPTGLFAPLARARVAALNRPATPAATQVTRAEPVPAPAPTDQAPAPAPRPPQQAALTPPSAPISASGIDGRYSGSLKTPTSAAPLALNIELNQGRITGFGTGGLFVCRMFGQVDGNGTIRLMEMDCPSQRGSTWFQFSGRFEAGAPASELKVRGGNLTNEMPVTWTRVQ